MDFLRALVSRLGRFLKRMEWNKLKRFDAEVEQFVREYRYRASDEPLLRQGMSGANPDIALVCAAVYHEQGPDRQLLVDCLLRTAYLVQGSAREACFGHLGRLQLSCEQGKQLLPFIPVAFYQDVPAELMSAIKAVQGPRRELLASMVEHWGTLRHNLYGDSYSLQGRSGHMMASLWAICQQVGETESTRFLRRQAILADNSLLPEPL
ncbi:MAG: hypothetical protein KC910_07580 [Candidatus Eremiobacteraeota bacterium]|nr:hypothetical protein [Candidatus Eremiobacteraeota bacterium]